jgi:predicted permease
VIAQFMMETAALFAIAGLLAGIGLLWLNEIVSRLQFLLPTPIVIDLAPDLRVGAFVIVLLVCAATAAGLVPALQATRVAPASAMKGEADAWTFSGSRLRNGFVVTQIAVSLLLLVTGALFVRSLSVTAALDPGLDPNNLEAISLNWFIAGYGENQPVEPFEKALLERVTSLPNVDSASIAVDVPMDGSGIGFNVVTIPGLQSNDRRQGVRNADWNLVSPGYFKTMKIPLLRGRDFTEHDRSGVAIINETMANRYWPGEDPIGKSFIDGEAKDGRPMQVIGIAKDTNTRYVGRPAEPMLYAPLGQYSWPQHYLMIRTIDGTSVAPAVRQIFLDLNPNLPIISVQSMSDLIGVGLLPQRIGAWVATIMGLLGVLLACLGVYGVTALSVTRRSREIGIRTALGARPADILHLAFREGMLLAFGGIAIGCALALALTRFIAGFLFGIGATDGASFVAASVLLAAVTLMACYIPARRAVRVDPTTALRSE